jgi:hypothetical protein
LIRIIKIKNKDKGDAKEKKKKKRCERKLIVIKIREIMRENRGRDKFEHGLVGSFFF